MAQAPTTSRSIDDDPGVGPGFHPGAPPAANQPASLGTPAGRGTGFAAVEPTAEQASSALPSLVAAYVLMWLLLLGFVWLVARRQARTEARLRELEQALLKPPPSP
jgi:CcmD family protein